VVTYVEGRGGTNADDAQRLLAASGWRGPRLLALPDWRTFGQVLLYLVGGIATWARDAGWRGLALFFDEAETVDKLDTTSRAMADRLLRYFAAATIPERELPFDPRSLYRGGHAVHRALPHVFEADQPLLVCFAFTPDLQVSRAMEAAGVGPARRVELGELAPSHLADLSRRLVDLYVELHPGLRDRLEEHAGHLLRHVERGGRHGLFVNVRDVARLTVELLDLVRHRPDLAADALVEV
jgi:hypothetical protein